MHKATNLAENKIVYDIEAPQNNSIIGDITCTVKYQKQIIENASDNKRSVLIVENEYQLYNNSELLLSLLNDNGSVEIIINSTEVEDSTDEDNNLEIGGANKSDNIGVAVDKKKNEKYFYFDMDSITINEIISAVVSGAKSVSERETPINGKSVVKLKVVYVKKYSILDFAQFILEISSIFIYLHIFVIFIIFYHFAHFFEKTLFYIILNLYHI